MSLVLVGACGTRAPAPVDAPQLEDAAEVDDLGVDTDVTLDESSAPDTGDEAEVDSPGGDVQDVFDVDAVAMDAFDTPDGSLADTPPDCVVRTGRCPCGPELSLVECCDAPVVGRATGYLFVCDGHGWTFGPFGTDVATTCTEEDPNNSDRHPHDYDPDRPFCHEFPGIIDPRDT